MFKVIIVGCGMVSDAWFDTINKREDCEIIALADVNTENAQGKKEKFNLSSNIYTNLKDALKNEKADVVIDITPPQYHFDTVTTALRAGCHVFGEKPMSDTLEQAEKMVACANETGNEYFVMQNRRYIPYIVALKNFVQENYLGNVGQLCANFQLDPRFGGFRDEMDSPLIADMAIHTFDAARFISGKNPVAVYCHEFNPSWSWYKGDASAVCIFEMEDGSVFDYRGSWCTHGIHTSWESEWRASCAKGSIFWDGEDKLYYDSGDKFDAKSGVLNPEKPGHILPVDLAAEGHPGCITDMFDSLAKGIRPQTDCRDNIYSIKMVYKAIESSKTKKRLEI